MVHLGPSIRLRLQRGSEHLQRLGARANAELLAKFAGQIDRLPATLTLLSEYERRLTPATLRLTGGDRFPPGHLRMVPRGEPGTAARGTAPIASGGDLAVAHDEARS
jgi:hypothetical protein